jgi:hypothetical protein
LVGDCLTPCAAGVSFKLDCYHHAIFAVRQWPRRTFPGIVAALTGMRFQEYAITLNVYPKRVDNVIEKEEQYIQRLQIDAISGANNLWFAPEPQSHFRTPGLCGS